MPHITLRFSEGDHASLSEALEWTAERTERRLALEAAFPPSRAERLGAQFLGRSLAMALAELCAYETGAQIVFVSPGLEPDDPPPEGAIA